MQGTILWENPSPNSAISSALQIDLSSANCEYLEIEYKAFTTSSSILFAKARNTANIPLMVATYPSAGLTVGYRNLTTSGDGIYRVDATFTGFRASGSGVSEITDSSMCIPIRIRGYT